MDLLAHTSLSPPVFIRRRFLVEARRAGSADSSQARPRLGPPRSLRLARSVLIVEDDAILRGQLAELFRMEGYGVTLAEDGLAALRLLMAGTEPDVILLDMHMEGLNGWEFGAELRQLEATAP